MAARQPRPTEQQRREKPLGTCCRRENRTREACMQAARVAARGAGNPACFAKTLQKSCSTRSSFTAGSPHAGNGRPNLRNPSDAYCVSIRRDLMLAPPHSRACCTRFASNPFTASRCCSSLNTCSQACFLMSLQHQIGPLDRPN